MRKQQLECRIVITHQGGTFELGMFDPNHGKYEPLGRHSIRDIKNIVCDLKVRMEREKHLVSFSEVHGPR